MKGSTRSNALLAMGAIAVSLLLFEGVSQVYAAQFYSRFERIRNHPLHYYQPSPDAELAYELKPGVYRNETSEARINRYGLREETDDLPEGRRRIAVLGDSVVFGISNPQSKTVSNALNSRFREAGVDAVAINFGVCGYALPELVRFFELRNDIYHVNELVFVLNLNDFAFRDGVYEGADNGVYRMYRRSFLKGPWLLRKAVYRLHRRLGNVHWYRWLFEGNRDAGFESIRRLHAYALAHDISLRVAILPAGSAYRDGVYELADVHGEITRFLAAEGIPHWDLSERLGLDPGSYFDDTDHLHDAGNELIADVIFDDLRLDRS
jgi:hypothetical protein